MGTDALWDEARRVQRGNIWGLEPAINSVNADPGIDKCAFRRVYGVASEELLVVSVSLLALEFKLDELVRAKDAVDMLRVLQILPQIRSSLFLQ